MRASDLFQQSLNSIQQPIKQYRRSVNPPYKSHDYLNLAVTLFLLLAVPLTVIVGLQARDIRKQAAEPEKKVESKKREVEFVSNEILIKVKKNVLSKVKSKPSPANTGVPSLNKLNKELKVKQIQRVSTPTKKTKNKNHDAFSWYMVTLPGKKEVIKEEAGKLNSLGLDGEAKDSKSKKIKKLLQDLGKYKKDSSIASVQLNYVVRLASLPNDTYVDPDQDGAWSSGAWGQSYEDMWGLKKIKADLAWAEATSSAQVKVAVVDTGLDYNHEDIKDNVWINSGEIPNNHQDDDGNGSIDDVYGASFVAGDITNDPIDEIGHGTHVAGIIAAAGNNSKGIIGVAPEVKIIPIKVIGYPFTGVDAAADSIIYAVDNEADVINNSWAACYNYCPSVPIIEDAVRYAFGQDVVLVFAAMNDYHADVANYSPQNMQEVITVSAFDQNDQIADFSNIGAGIDVAAPGVDILSLKVNDTRLCRNAISVGTNYCLAKGTSMAAPHVSGLAALIRSKHPEFTNEEVKAVIKQSSDDVYEPGWDVYSGSGRINAFAALQIDNPVIPPYIKILDPDIDNDGAVSVGDIFAIVGAFGTAKGGAGFNISYDLNDDGAITVGDIFLAIGNFGLTWPPINVQEGFKLNFYVSGTGPDGNTITYSMSGLPSNATINPTTGQVLWMPTATQSGNYTATFKANDGTSDSDPVTLTIIVLNTQ